MTDPVVLNSIFQGLVALLGAVGGLIAILGRRTGEKRVEDRRTRGRLEIALGYIFRLRFELAEHGLAIPAPPPGLDDGDGADGGDPASTRVGGPHG